METKRINVLNIHEWRIVKSIRIEKQFGPRYMWAELVYTRDVSNNYGLQVEKKTSEGGIFYDYVKSYTDDEFDNIILKAVQTEYPNATFKSHEVVTNMDVDMFKHLYASQIKDQAIVYLNPGEIDYGKLPADSTLLQFRIPIELYIPCKEFQPHFCNEGYFSLYDNNRVDELQQLLEEVKSSFHGLSELIK